MSQQPANGIGWNSQPIRSDPQSPQPKTPRGSRNLGSPESSQFQFFGEHNSVIKSILLKEKDPRRTVKWQITREGLFRDSRQIGLVFIDSTTTTVIDGDAVVCSTSRRSESALSYLLPPPTKTCPVRSPSQSNSAAKRAMPFGVTSATPRGMEWNLQFRPRPPSGLCVRVTASDPLVTTTPPTSSQGPLRTTADEDPRGPYDQSGSPGALPPSMRTAGVARRHRRFRRWSLRHPAPRVRVTKLDQSRRLTKVAERHVHPRRGDDAHRNIEQLC
jgi:hypothetical protein